LTVSNTGDRLFTPRVSIPTRSGSRRGGRHVSVHSSAHTSRAPHAPESRGSQTYLNVDAQSTASNVHVNWQLQEGESIRPTIRVDRFRRAAALGRRLRTVRHGETRSRFPRQASNDYFEVPRREDVRETVVFVDASRQQVTIPDCFDCQRFGYATFPAFSRRWSRARSRISAGRSTSRTARTRAFGPFYICGPSWIRCAPMWARARRCDSGVRLGAARSRAARSRSRASSSRRAARRGAALELGTGEDAVP
jgi:hypothetical protein